jgi:hypothetical protein
LISALDGVDVEASAKKARPSNQSLGVAVFKEGREQNQVREKNCDPLQKIMISLLDVTSQPFRLWPGPITQVTGLVVKSRCYDS